MEEKYYTPEISEFHVGFECEIRSNKQDEFIKSRVGLYSVSAMGISHPLTTLMAYPINKDERIIGINVLESELEGFVRVKYLDESDITECGWGNPSEVPFTVFEELKTTEYCMKHEKRNANYYLWHNKPNNLVSIYFHDLVTLNKLGHRIFEGIIRNKSELKLVMKMLGINAN